MSMISSQRDTLLVMADALEDEYPSLAREVMRAADTIWELRNKLAGVIDQSEEIDKRTAELDFQIADNWKLTVVSKSLKEQNDKLREQIHWLKKGDVLHVLTDQELADQQKHEREMRASITALDDENARLRSCLSDDAENARQILAENAKLRELLADTLMDTRDYCAKYGLDYDGLGWNSANDDIDRRLRELGIEVK